MKKGAKALVLYQGKFLFILRDNKPGIRNPNIWNLPGGAVEVGETYDEGLRRELLEEICVVPKQITYIGKKYFERMQATIAVYLVLLDDQEYPQVKLGNEGQDLQFFTPKEVLELPLADTEEYFTSIYPALVRVASGEMNFRPEEFQVEA